MPTPSGTSLFLGFKVEIKVTVTAEERPEVYMLTLDKPNQLFLQLFLSSRFFQIIHASQVIDYITSFSKVYLCYNKFLDVSRA
jgi:hypothetical protein